MKHHDWREPLEQGWRYFRGTWHGHCWSIGSRFADEDEYQLHDPPGFSDLHVLREILLRKYHRRNVPWECIDALDSVIESFYGEKGEIDTARQLDQSEQRLTEWNEEWNKRFEAWKSRDIYANPDYTEPEADQ